MEVHHHVFDYFKELFLRWYEKDGGEKASAKKPNYKHPDTQEELTYETIDELFKAGDRAK